MQNETSVTKVILLRHAQTNFNIENRCDNSNRTSFTELGEKQIVELQETLSPLEVDKVYCSPMERCLNTI
ncbi:MAG: phosphoglycerate mutase family protein [bacterium]